MCINIGNRTSKYYFYMIILTIGIAGVLESEVKSYKYQLSNGNSELVEMKPLRSKNLIYVHM